MHLALSLHSVQWFRLEMDTFPLLPLNTLGMSLVSQIPATFDPVTDYSFWVLLFVGYGTHLTISADFGGVVWAEDWYQSCVEEMHSETWVKSEYSKKYDPIGCFSDDVQTSEHTRIVHEDLDYRSISAWETHGGYDIPPEKWQEWTPTM